MRVCIITKTQKLIESQSGGDGQTDLDVLISNAVTAGLNKDQITVTYVSDKQYQELMGLQVNKQPESEPAMTVNDLASILINKGVLADTDISIKVTPIKVLG